VPQVRILIADDHELIRRGLRSILITRPEFEICAEVADGREAIEAARSLKPDVVLLDITMPHVNGFDATRVIRRDVPQAKVIILSQYDESDVKSRALEAGAQGYISKSDASNQLLIAIDALIDSDDPDLADKSGA
jgi:DNA-binding NarL/FixJ family response regulator